jgi:hypothetical protein
MVNSSRCSLDPIPLLRSEEGQRLESVEEVGKAKPAPGTRNGRSLGKPQRKTGKEASLARPAGGAEPLPELTARAEMRSSLRQDGYQRAHLPGLRRGASGAAGAVDASQHPQRTLARQRLPPADTPRRRKRLRWHRLALSVPFCRETGAHPGRKWRRGWVSEKWKRTNQPPVSFYRAEVHPPRGRARPIACQPGAAPVSLMSVCSLPPGPRRWHRRHNRSRPRCRR